MPSTTGADQYVHYLWEPSFGTTPTDSTYKTFGTDARLTRAEGANNAVEQLDPGSRQAQDHVEMHFSGAFSAQFTLSNPWWLEAVLDSPATTGTSPNFTHSFTGTDPQPVRIFISDDRNTVERVLEGCIINSATITATVQNEAQVTLEGAYKTESSATSLSVNSQTAPTYRKMTFAQATLDLGGTPYNVVQNAAMSITNNVDMIYELGSRFAADYSPKIRRTNVQFNKLMEGHDSLKEMYGGSATTEPQDTVENTATVNYIFDNGKTGADANKLTFTMTSAFPENYSASGYGDPAADITQQLNRLSSEMTAEAQNAESASP